MYDPVAAVRAIGMAHRRAVVSLAIDAVSQEPRLARGLVWCVTCGREQEVVAAWRLRHGWPTCCGATMTIDSPEERAEVARQTAAAAAEFTYYCGEHRDQVTTGAPPSARHKAGGFTSSPCCPTCHEPMFWVPNGATVTPALTPDQWRRAYQGEWEEPEQSEAYARHLSRITTERTPPQ